MSFWTKKSKEEEGQVTSTTLPAPAVLGSNGLSPSSNSNSTTTNLSVGKLSAGDADLEVGSNKKINPEDVITERFGGKLRSVLGPGTVIQGKLSFDTPVRIDGKLGGEVFSTKALIVGPTGVVDARLEVASLIVMGKVNGSVKATEKIEVFAGGVLSADIQTASLVIDNGIFNGVCKMESSSRIANVEERTNPRQKDGDRKVSEKSDSSNPGTIATSSSTRTDSVVTAQPTL